MKPTSVHPSPAWVSGALILLGLGIVATYDLNHSATERILPAALRGLIWVGPSLALLGLLLLLRNFRWGARFLSRRNVLTAGLVMLGAGVLVAGTAAATERGGDASWVNGMWFLMAGIFAGLPGVLLTLAALLLKTDGQR